MKAFFTKVLNFLKKIKFRWFMVYAAFAVLVYIHFLGFLGTIGMTLALILLNNKIHEIGTPGAAPASPK